MLLIQNQVKRSSHEVDYQVMHTVFKKPDLVLPRLASFLFSIPESTVIVKIAFLVKFTVYREKGHFYSQKYEITVFFLTEWTDGRFELS